MSAEVHRAVKNAILLEGEARINRKRATFGRRWEDADAAFEEGITDGYLTVVVGMLKAIGVPDER